MRIDFLERMDLNQRSLAGKVAVVTGAGSGIGHELARALAWLGAKVVIAEIDRATGAATEQLIRDEGGEALFVQTDVASERSVASLKERVEAAYERVDILVNNALVTAFGSILELPLEAWDRTHRVNLRGAVMGVKTFLPGMLERREGTVVMITSAEGMGYAAPYFASKTALRSLAFSLATELGEDSGVSVFIFAPGMVDTPGFRESLDEMPRWMGLTPHEFTHLGANAGYDGLMPAEDCAAGTANRQSPSTPVPVTTANAPAADALQLSKGLLEIMTVVKRETAELGVFQRAWVARTFQQRAGLTVDDWLRTAEDLSTELAAFHSTGASNKERLQSRLPWLKTSLNRLADNFHKNCEDAKGWIKDPEALQIALEELEHREKTARALSRALDRFLD
jgi:NAD(P)-dependent dehydrogenase (short-subunit alcohol dehydrogenase family)